MLAAALAAYVLASTGAAQAAAPTVVIDSGPTQGSVTTVTSTAFSFHSPDTGTSFTCSLDGITASCASPVSYVNLSSATHTFTVAATDDLGQTGPAVPRSWTVDTIAPVTSINGVLPGLVTNSTSVTFGFSSEPGATFRCSLDSPSTPTAVCSSPATFTMPKLTEGTHVFYVAARDAAGNVEAPAQSVQVVIDRTPPPPATGLTGKTPVVAKPQVTWSAAGLDDRSGLSHYAVFRGTPGPANGPIPSCANVPLSGPLVCVDPAAPAGNDSYSVATYDRAGNMSLSAPFTVTVDPNSASAARSLSAHTPTNVAPHLTWSAPANATFGNHYLVFRDGSQTPLGPAVSGTSYDDARGGPPSPGWHTYQVQAFNAGGNPGTVSAAIQVLYDPTPPSSPGTLSVAAARSGVSLSWGASTDNPGGSGLSRYIVRRSSNGTVPGLGGGVAVCDVGPLVNSCGDASASGGVDYTYAVYATDAAGNASPAASGKIRLVGPDITPPGRPRRFLAGFACPPERLSWINPTDLDFDHVVLTVNRKHRPTRPFDGKIVYAGKKSFAFFQPTMGLGAFFAIFAFDHAHNRSIASVARVQPQRLCPATSRVSGTPRFAWVRVPGAHYYNILVYQGRNPTSTARPVIRGWPTTNGFQTSKSKLVPGKVYTWYVWPGVGPRSAARYGKLIGHATFRYTHR